MLTWKRTKRPLGALKRPNKSRRRLFWTILGPKWKSRGAQDRPKIGPKRKKKRAPTLGKCVFSSSCSSCGRKRPTFSIWGRFEIDLGSMLGWTWGYLGSNLNRSVCLSLSAIQTSRNNCQTTHLLSLDSHSTDVHFERCLRPYIWTNFEPLVVLKLPPNKCIV
jgi:hypothetical protein